MKYIISFGTLIAFQLFASTVIAQRTPWIKTGPQSLMAGKGERFYCTKANQLAKAGNYRAAILNACQCYTMADNQKKLKRTAERLIEYVPLAKSRSADQLDELKNTPANPLDKKAEAIFKGINIIKEQMAVRTALENLPDKSCKKCPPLNFDLQNYETGLKEWESLYQEVAAQAAQAHFEQAQTHANDRSRSQSLQGVRSCRMALFYQPDHDQAKGLLAELKPLAMTHMAVTLLKNNTGLNLVPTVEWTHAIINETRKKHSPKLDLFQLLPFDQAERANVLFHPSLENLIIGEKRNEPTEKKCECATKIDGREVVLKATVTTYSKQIDVTIGGLSTIRDKTSDLTLARKPIEISGSPWSYSWATYSGDKRTFDCKKYRFYKRFIAKKEVAYPTDQEVMNMMKGEIVKKFTEKIIQFSQKVGQ